MAKRINIKELAEKLGLTELDTYDLIVLGGNVPEEDENGEWFAPDYALELAEIAYEKACILKQDRPRSQSHGQSGQHHLRSYHPSSRSSQEPPFLVSS